MPAHRAALALRCGTLLLGALLVACHTAPVEDPAAAAARRLIAEAQLYLPEAGPEFGQRPTLSHGSRRRMPRPATLPRRSGCSRPPPRTRRAATTRRPSMALLAGILYLQTQAGATALPRSMR